MANNNMGNNMNGNSIIRALIRFGMVGLVLWLVSIVTPGFMISGIFSLFLAAVIIAALDYIIESFMGVDVSPFGKGLKGFAISAVIIFLAQYFVPDMSVTIIGALLAAAVIGIMDMIVPVRVI